MFQIITILNQADAKAIRFLMAGVSQDESRETLTYIYLDAGRNLAVAADGFRLHSCPIPESLHEYAGKLVKPEGQIKKGRMIFEIRENGEKPPFRYPTYFEVIENMEKKEVFYQVAFTTDLLRKSLSRIDSLLGKINFRAPDQPFEIFPVGAEDEMRVILMPAHNNAQTIELNKLYQDLEQSRAALASLKARQVTTRLKALKSEEANRLLARYQELDKELIVLENQANDQKAAEKVTGKQ